MDCFHYKNCGNKALTSTVLLLCDCLISLCHDCARKGTLICLSSERQRRKVQSEITESGSTPYEAYFCCPQCNFQVTTKQHSVIHGVDQALEAQEMLIRAAMTEVGKSYFQYTTNFLDLQECYTLLHEHNELSKPDQVNHDSEAIAIAFMRHAIVSLSLTLFDGYEDPLKYITFTENRLYHYYITDNKDEYSSRCIACLDPISLGYSVQLTCPCKYQLCRTCVLINVHIRPETYHNGVHCVLCKQPSRGILCNTEYVVDCERALIQSALHYSSKVLTIKDARSAGSERINLLAMIKLYNCIGYEGNLDILSEKERDSATLPRLRLEVAKLEESRLNRLDFIDTYSIRYPVNKTVNSRSSRSSKNIIMDGGNEEESMAGKFPIGFLHALSVTKNAFFEHYFIPRTKEKADTSEHKSIFSAHCSAILPQLLQLHAEDKVSLTLLDNLILLSIRECERHLLPSRATKAPLSYSTDRIITLLAQYVQSKFTDFDVKLIKSEDTSQFMATILKKLGNKRIVEQSVQVLVQRKLLQANAQAPVEYALETKGYLGLLMDPALMNTADLAEYTAQKVATSTLAKTCTTAMTGCSVSTTHTTVANSVANTSTAAAVSAISGISAAESRDNNTIDLSADDVVSIDNSPTTVAVSSTTAQSPSVVPVPAIAAASAAPLSVVSAAGTSTVNSVPMVNSSRVKRNKAPPPPSSSDDGSSSPEEYRHTRCMRLSTPPSSCFEDSDGEVRVKRHKVKRPKVFRRQLAPVKPPAKKRKSKSSAAEDANESSVAGKRLKRTKPTLTRASRSVSTTGSLGGRPKERFRFKNGVMQPYITLSSSSEEEVVDKRAEVSHPGWSSTSTATSSTSAAVVNSARPGDSDDSTGQTTTRDTNTTSSASAAVVTKTSEATALTVPTQVTYNRIKKKQPVEVFYVDSDTGDETAKSVPRPDPRNSSNSSAAKNHKTNTNKIDSSTVDLTRSNVPSKRTILPNVTDLTGTSDLTGRNDPSSSIYNATARPFATSSPSVSAGASSSIDSVNAAKTVPQGPNMAGTHLESGSDVNNRHIRTTCIDKPQQQRESFYANNSWGPYGRLPVGVGSASSRATGKVDPPVACPANTFAELRRKWVAPSNINKNLTSQPNPTVNNATALPTRPSASIPLVVATNTSHVAPGVCAASPPSFGTSMRPINAATAWFTSELVADIGNKQSVTVPQVTDLTTISENRASAADRSTTGGYIGSAITRPLNVDDFSLSGSETEEPPKGHPVTAMNIKLAVPATFLSPVASGMCAPDQHISCAGAPVANIGNNLSITDLTASALTATTSSIKHVTEVGITNNNDSSGIAKPLTVDDFSWSDSDAEERPKGYPVSATNIKLVVPPSTRSNTKKRTENIVPSSVLNKACSDHRVSTFNKTGRVFLRLPEALEFLTNGSHDAKFPYPYWLAVAVMAHEMVNDADDDALVNAISCSEQTALCGWKSGGIIHTSLSESIREARSNGSNNASNCTTKVASANGSQFPSNYMETLLARKRRRWLEHFYWLPPKKNNIRGKNKCDESSDSDSRSGEPLTLLEAVNFLRTTELDEFPESLRWQAAVECSQSVVATASAKQVKLARIPGRMVFIGCDASNLVDRDIQDYGEVEAELRSTRLSCGAFYMVVSSYWEKIQCDYNLSILLRERNPNNRSYNDRFSNLTVAAPPRRYKRLYRRGHRLPYPILATGDASDSDEYMFDNIPKTKKRRIVPKACYFLFNTVVTSRGIKPISGEAITLRKAIKLLVMGEIVLLRDTQRAVLLQKQAHTILTSTKEIVLATELDRSCGVTISAEYISFWRSVRAGKGANNTNNPAYWSRFGFWAGIESPLASLCVESPTEDTATSLAPRHPTLLSPTRLLRNRKSERLRNQINGNNINRTIGEVELRLADAVKIVTLRAPESKCTHPFWLAVVRSAEEVMAAATEAKLESVMSGVEAWTCKTVRKMEKKRAQDEQKDGNAKGACIEPIVNRMSNTSTNTRENMRKTKLHAPSNPAMSLSQYLRWLRRKHRVSTIRVSDSSEDDSSSASILSFLDDHISDISPYDGNDVKKRCATAIATSDSARETHKSVGSRTIPVPHLSVAVSSSTPPASLPDPPLTNKQRRAERQAEELRIDKLHVFVTAMRHPETADSILTNYHAWVQGKVVRKESFRKWGFETRLRHKGMDLFIREQEQQFKNAEIKERRCDVKVRALRRAAAAHLGVSLSAPDQADADSDAESEAGSNGESQDHNETGSDAGSVGECDDVASHSKDESSIEESTQSESEVSLNAAVQLMNRESVGDGSSACSADDEQHQKAAARAILSAKDCEIAVAMRDQRSEGESSETDYLTDIELENMYMQCGGKRKRRSLRHLCKRRHCVPYPITSTVSSDSELSDDECVNAGINGTAALHRTSRHLRRHRKYAGHVVYSDEEETNASPAAKHRAAQKMVRSLLKPIVGKVLRYIAAKEEIRSLVAKHVDADQLAKRAKAAKIKERARNVVISNGPPKEICTDGMTKNQRKGAIKKYRNALNTYNQAVAAAGKVCSTDSAATSNSTKANAPVLSTPSSATASVKYPTYPSTVPKQNNNNASTAVPRTVAATLSTTNKPPASMSIFGSMGDYADSEESDQYDPYDPEVETSHVLTVQCESSVSVLPSATVIMSPSRSARPPPPSLPLPTGLTRAQPIPPISALAIPSPATSLFTHSDQTQSARPPPPSLPIPHVVRTAPSRFSNNAEYHCNDKSPAPQDVKVNTLIPPMRTTSYGAAGNKPPLPKESTNGLPPPPPPPLPARPPSPPPSSPEPAFRESKAGEVGKLLSGPSVSQISPFAAKPSPPPEAIFPMKRIFIDAVHSNSERSIRKRTDLSPSRPNSVENIYTANAVRERKSVGGFSANEDILPQTNTSVEALLESNNTSDLKTLLASLQKLSEDAMAEAAAARADRQFLLNEIAFEKDLADSSKVAHEEAESEIKQIRSDFLADYEIKKQIRRDMIEIKIRQTQEQTTTSCEILRMDSQVDDLEDEGNRKLAAKSQLRDRLEKKKNVLHEEGRRLKIAKNQVHQLEGNRNAHMKWLDRSKAMWVERQAEEEAERRVKDAEIQQLQTEIERVTQAATDMSTNPHLHQNISKSHALLDAENMNLSARLEALKEALTQQMQRRATLETELKHTWKEVYLEREAFASNSVEITELQEDRYDLKSYFAWKEEQDRITAEQRTRDMEMLLDSFKS